MEQGSRLCNRKAMDERCPALPARPTVGPRARGHSQTAVRGRAHSPLGSAPNGARRFRRSARVLAWAAVVGIGTWVGDLDRPAKPALAHSGALEIHVVPVVAKRLWRSSAALRRTVERFVSANEPNRPCVRQVEEWFAEEQRRYAGDRAVPVHFHGVVDPILVDALPTLPPPARSHPWRRLVGGVVFRQRLEAIRRRAGRSGPAVFLCITDVGEDAAEGSGTASPADGFAAVYTSLRDVLRGRIAAVIAHEAAHLLGATDKYRDDGHARFPDGYADPNRRPVHPQTHAEIMALELPRGPGEFQVVLDLDQCAVGEATAAELGWTTPAGAPRPQS